MNPWIRLYRASLHNPKIVMLNDRQHRCWHNCLLMADDKGALPKMRDMACHMRMTVQEAEQVICELVECGLVDIEGMGAARVFKMHDWDVHQYVSDSSTERVRKFRKKNSESKDETAVKRFSNGDVTPPESEPDTEPDTENKLLPSEQVAARGKELGIDYFGLKKVSKKKGQEETVKRQAEALGLDVDEIMGTIKRNNVRNPSAYFTTLCVNRLKEKLPGIKESTIREAIWGNDAAFGKVSAALVGYDA